MWNIVRKWFTRKDNNSKGIQQQKEDEANRQKNQAKQNQQLYTRYSQRNPKIKLTRNMQDNIESIKNAMSNNFDIKVREFKLTGQRSMGHWSIYQA